MTITAKQQRFVDEYFVDLNATQAAIRAGFSKKTARQRGARLLSNVAIAAAIQAGQAKQEERTGVTADRVIDELALIPSGELTDSAARALREVVSTVSVTEHGPSRRLHVKQHDKLAALRMLCQHLGLFKDKIEMTHSRLGNVFDEIRRRARELERRMARRTTRCKPFSRRGTPG